MTDMLCDAHLISACGVCLGTVPQWEPPEPSEGTRRKRYTAPPQSYLYPLYNEPWRKARVPAPPAPVYEPTGALEDLQQRTPRNDHGFAAHRATRNGHLVTARKRVYRPQPKPKPKPYSTSDATLAAREANRKLAAELDITLPE